MADTLQLTEEQIQNYRQVFLSYDTNGDGEIPADKLGEVMRRFGQVLTRAQLQDLIDEVDIDGSGTIEWEEFLPLWAAKIKEKEEVAYYKNLFRMLDKNKEGSISCDDLREILHEFAKKVDLTEDDVDAMVDDIDEDGNGKISFDEFYNLMTS